MLNRDLLSAARSRLQESVTSHQKAAKRTIAACTNLYELRKGEAHQTVREVETFVNTMRKKPADFQNAIDIYKVNYSAFDRVIVDFDDSVREATVKTAAGTGVGVAAGAATAFMGPTVAMAVATTFGTASTGTAISALSGVAATNAALAWLGGGALVAGGGGMGAGGALLGLAGPVGWGLAGLAATGGVLYMRHTNSKAAGEAENKRAEVEAEIRSIQASEIAVKKLYTLTNDTTQGLRSILMILRDVLKVKSPEGQPADVLDMMKAMVNHVQSLGELLVKNVELKAN